MNFTYYLQELRDNLELGSERSHYYALKTLIDSAEIGINAIIEERGNQAGIPDFTVRKNNSLIGYIEAKKIGEDLNKIQQSEQLKRYFESSVGQNLILTNFLEFRWFQDGKLQQVADVGVLKDEQILGMKTPEKITKLLKDFVNYQEKTINNYLDLAQQMAVYTKSIKFAIADGLILENETGELTKLKGVFTDLLIPDLDEHDFSDMYAQTIAYGLFTARVGHGTLTPNPSPKGEGSKVFNRQTASLYIGNKTPFLKGLFDTVITTNIMPQIDWAIDNLIELFAKIDMSNILENFGQSTKREDPVIHFYETFLGAYSADLRKSRGVYYTPEPVVYFMVKAVNNILDQDFDVLDGLGHRDVTILDPATGTGTFLYQVIKQICNNYYQYSPTKWNHNWSKYFKDRKVLERLFGFELLMTPYTIAHLKLQLLLENLGYQFTENERLNIFLTNALDEGLKKSEVLLGEYIAQEANAAAQVKKETKIIVILGNPPYSGHSANKNSWINSFVKDYYTVDGLPLDEKNPKWLQDDYVKFIRFAQLKLDKVEGGILAFITNHGYLDNPTFRGMRQNLMQSFSRIYIINLHGNIKKKEVSPDGSKDENVFDIQQGVSILIAIKDISKENLNFFVKFNPNFQTPAQGIYYFDLWGKRAIKYEFLENNDFHNIEWEKINPVSPFYLFTPQDDILKEEYNNYWKITDIMPVNSVGIVTARDSLTIQNTHENVEEIVTDFVSLSEEEAREKYDLGKDSQDWKVSLAQKDIRDSKGNKDFITPILYRPFDIKYTYYTGKASGFICRPRNEVMKNMLLGDNLALITVRQQSQSGEWFLVGISQEIIESCAISNKTKEINYLFPLYIYPNTQNGQANLITEKEANFSPQFLTNITEKLGYTPSPENIFYYIYAVLHSPNYRERYAPFLKIDFPRVPLTSNNEKFTQLATKGEELVNLHLLKKLPNVSITKNQTLATIDLPLFSGNQQGKIHYQGDGKNEINQITYNSKEQKISINKDCYFTGITEEVWEFKIGGYQVLDKWLKDRKKSDCSLSSEDITHYQKIIVALQETIIIMAEIDKIICEFPMK